MKWLCFADKDALVCGDRHLSYRALATAIAHTSAVMGAHTSRGDRVVLLGANSLEWVCAFYGVWHFGGVAVPVDFMSTPEEIAFILSDCRPAVVWTDGQTRGKLSKALELLEGWTPVVMSLDSLSKICQGASEDGDPAHSDASASLGESPDSELALLVYTSGTTGSPKGVMLSFGNLFANTNSVGHEIEVFIPADRVMVILPLHHAYPLMGSLIMPLSIGATAVLAPEMTGPSILETLQKHHCTFIVAVPRLLELFRNAIMQKIRASLPARALFRICRGAHSLALSRKIFKKVQDTFGGSIRYIASGGAAAAPELIRDFYALGFELLEGYGMTETAPMISFTRPGRVRPGSPGIPIPCNQVRTEDGEVLVKGNNVMMGYYHRPGETAEVLTPDGWLHTGDLGYVDKDGFLFLTGRKKELIILGNGKNINPAELEESFAKHVQGLLTEWAVAEHNGHLAVVGVPDVEALKKRGIVNIQETLADQILEPYNLAAPSYKRLGSLILWNHPLPRTRLGKIRRHIIQKELNGETVESPQSTQEPPPDTPAYKMLAQCLEAIAGRAPKPDEHLELDLGLDSLAKLTLVSTLERDHGITLTPQELSQYATPRALAQHLEEHAAETAELPAEAGKAGVPAKAPELPRPACTHGLFRILGKGFLKTISRMEVRGLENIPAGPCVIAPNHQSALDGLYVGTALSPERFRNTYFYAAAKFVTGGLTGFLARRHNVIPMDLNGNLRETLEMLQRALHEGKSIVIFPEGTRSLDGSLSPFRHAFAKLAQQSNIPILPVAIKDSIRVLPRGKSFPVWGQKVTVAFLPPIMPTSRDSLEDLAERTRKGIEEALER